MVAGGGWTVAGGGVYTGAFAGNAGGADSEDDAALGDAVFFDGLLLLASKVAISKVDDSGSGIGRLSCNANLSDGGDSAVPGTMPENQTYPKSPTATTAKPAKIFQFKFSMPPPYQMRH